MFDDLGRTCTRRLVTITTAILICSAPAFAGGYDTGERDWDFMFQPEQFAVEAGVRYFHPERTLSNIPFSIDVKEGEDLTVQRYGLAARLADHLRCLASYREPWGGHAEYGTAWAYTGSSVAQHFTSADYGLTCAVSAALDTGVLSFIAGASQQKITYEISQIWPGPTPVTTTVDDTSYGWRTGLAFEIPEYALRASLIYNSAIDYDMTGPNSVVGPVAGSLTMPQSVELKAQSGIAPGWLAFGAIKWTDWSVSREMPICTAGTASCFYGAPTLVTGLALLFKDTWTITAGLAHAFSENLTLAGSLTWDQGATEGFTSQTDTWIANLNAVITPHENVQINLGGSVGLMTGGSLSTLFIGSFANPVGYTATFGDDLIYTLSASAVFRF